MTERLRIDEERFRRDFDALAEIGSTGDGGVHRPALSDDHLAARRWFRERAEADGLEFREDGAGNHSARLRSAKRGAKTLLVGSHLDSVPYGGRFDGALGVVSALEVLRTVAASGTDPGVHLEAVDFTDEEGTLVGLLGSRAMAGSLTKTELRSPRCGRKTLKEALGRAGLDVDGVLGARRDPEKLAGFLEVHIEQGPRLVDGRLSIGVVTGIVGIGSLAVKLTGRPDHAGTTPLAARRDAGLGAAHVMVEVAEAVQNGFVDCVINVGRVGFSPGAHNIVPGEAELAIEFRAPSNERLDELEEALTERIRSCAKKRRLEVELRRDSCLPPSPCSPEAREAFTAACNHLDLRHIAIASGAGHDTGAMAHVCPSGMIFVPSTGGSHSPSESAEWSDCVTGANVLLLATLEMAKAATRSRRGRDGARK